MARAPRAKVSMTSGQGVSRLSYQKAYAMKGDGPKVDTKFSTAKDSERQYGKTKVNAKGSGPGFNVSYGDTYRPTDIEDVKALGEGKPDKGWDLGRKASKKPKGG